jgi:FixJ family two-component response regulator
MSGAELLSILKRLAPDLKVIAASGYLEPELKAEIFDQGAIDFLPKPYMASELLKRISRALTQQIE